ncbi:glycosyltransferase [Vibrio cholerae]|uniref:glycosyltransferase n=1 Tax=Vibrio cholerae TaxID=666 RepID=UPI003080DC2F|nr:glycosyltransferase [Vibrio cholerae]
MVNVRWESYKGSKIFEDIHYRFSKYLEEISGLVLTESDYYDILHVHRLDRISIRKDRKFKIVATIHFDLSDITMFHDYDIFVENVKVVDEFICLNNSQAEHLKKMGVYQRINIIPHGYDARSFSNIENRLNYKRLKRKTSIGFLSRRYPSRVKGENLLFEIATYLNPSEYCFILSGQDRYIDSIKLRNLGFEVFLISNSDYGNVIKSYKLLDCALILSKSEGGPASLPDLLLSGVKVIAKPVGMCKDINHGNLIKANTIEDFLLKIREVRYSRGECELLESKCPSYGLYSWDSVFDMLVDTYLRLCVKF